MPELAIEPRNWAAAINWARSNAKALGLAPIEPELPLDVEGTIWLGKEMDKWQARSRDVVPGFGLPEFLSLKFEPGKALDRKKDTLSRIIFGIRSSRGANLSVDWNAHYTSAGEPPENLEGLIRAANQSWVGQKLPAQEQAHLKAAADLHPGFYEAYSEIFKELFPPVEHWKLHTGEEEYSEALKIDDTLMRRLRN